MILKKRSKEQNKTVFVIIPIIIFIISRGCCDDPTSNFSNISTADWDLRHRHNVRIITMVKIKYVKMELAIFVSNWRLPQS